MITTGPLSSSQFFITRPLLLSLNKFSTQDPTNSSDSSTPSSSSSSSSSSKTSKKKDGKFATNVQRKVNSFALNTLKDHPRARRVKRRIGRGRGSGRGKTSGYGHKGQRARSRIKQGFEGGQTPFYRRIPKHGNAIPPFLRRRFNTLNLGQLQRAFDTDVLPHDGRAITPRLLFEAGLITGKLQSGIKLLGDGKEIFREKVNIEVSQASESAVQAIEGLGGKVTKIYWNKLGFRSIVKHKPHPSTISFAFCPLKYRKRYQVLKYFYDPSTASLDWSRWEEAKEEKEQERELIQQQQEAKK